MNKAPIRFNKGTVEQLLHDFGGATRCNREAVLNTLQVIREKHPDAWLIHPSESKSGKWEFHTRTIYAEGTSLLGAAQLFSLAVGGKSAGVKPLAEILTPTTTPTSTLDELLAVATTDCDPESASFIAHMRALSRQAANGTFIEDRGVNRG